MSATKPMDIVIACENKLGWQPNTKQPLFKARAVEAMKLKRAMEKDPVTYTIANLELAVEWSWRHRKPVTSPAALIHRVEAALERSAAPVETTELGERVQAAVDRELALDRPESTEWIARLTRAFGVFREDVLTEWKEAGRG